MENFSPRHEEEETRAPEREPGASSFFVDPTEGAEEKEGPGMADFSPPADPTPLYGQMGIKDLAHLVFRRGGLYDRSLRARSEMSEGYRVQRRFTQWMGEELARIELDSDPAYRPKTKLQTELPVRASYEKTIGGHPLFLNLEGRIDVLTLLSYPQGKREKIVNLYEVKSLSPSEARSHQILRQGRYEDWAQVCLYAYALRQSTDWETLWDDLGEDSGTDYPHTEEPSEPSDPLIQVQLVYYLRGEEVPTILTRKLDLEALTTFFVAACEGYLALQEPSILRRIAYPQAALRATFPFANLRNGQETIMRSLLATIRRRDVLLINAPTGIGKTVSVLYPALKALATGAIPKILYLTAMTAGRRAAAQTAALLQAKGFPCRTLILYAKESLCLEPKLFCQTDRCPYAREYFQKIRSAILATGADILLDRPRLLALAKEFQVCPYELALEMIPTSDLVVADYNHYFDPTARIRSLSDLRGEIHLEAKSRSDPAFGPQPGPAKPFVLVDEAHNLAQRAKMMYSAGLGSGKVEKLRALLIQCQEASQGLLARPKSQLTPRQEAEAWRALEHLQEDLEILHRMAQAFLSFLSPSGKEKAASGLGLRENPGRAEPGEKLGRAEPGEPLIDMGQFAGEEKTIREPGLLLAKAYPKEFPTFFQSFVEHLNQFLNSFGVELVEALVAPKGKQEAEGLAGGAEAADPESLIRQVFYEVRFFTQVLTDYFGDSYLFAAQRTKQDGIRWSLLCLDVAHILTQGYEDQGGICFFSATMLPIPYQLSLVYDEHSELDAKILNLEEVFPVENRKILGVTDVPFAYRSREGSVVRIARLLVALTKVKTANYLIFAPSYAYLAILQKTMTKLAEEEDLDDTDLVFQKKGMTDQEKQAFLQRFASYGKRSLLAFAVLGSVFSEGVDLPGEQLSGVIILGVGNPSPDLERRLICDYYEQKLHNGYQYAYTYPAFNKVTQALGRLIRSDEDRGFVLLIDERWGQGAFYQLAKENFRDYQLTTLRGALEIIQNFWQGQ